MRSRRSTFRGFCRPALFRLQGLVTLLVVYSLRAVPTLFQVGSAYGIAPSELSPPERYPWLSPRMHPLAVSPACDRPSLDGGVQFATSGLCPFRESLAAHTRLTYRRAGCSLGFCFPEFATKIFTGANRNPLLRFRGTVWSRSRRRSRVSIDLRPVRLVAESNHSLKLSAPVLPMHSNPP